MTPTHVVFDVAGVLLQWQPHRLLQRTLASLALDDAGARAWVPRFFGEGFGAEWSGFDRGTCEADALAHAIARRTRLPLPEVRAVVDGIPQVLQPMVDTVALVQRLRARRVPLHFLSNMPAPYADALEAMHPELFAQFVGGVFSGRVRMIKPEPEIYAHTARRFALPPSRTLFIDDYAPNVDAARAAGWHALQFIDAAQCEREFAALGVL